MVKATSIPMRILHGFRNNSSAPWPYYWNMMGSPHLMFSYIVISDRNLPHRAAVSRFHVYLDIRSMFDSQHIT